MHGNCADVCEPGLIFDFTTFDFCTSHPTLETITQNFIYDDRNMSLGPEYFVYCCDPHPDPGRFAQLRPGLFRDLNLNIRDEDAWDALISFLGQVLYLNKLFISNLNNDGDSIQVASPKITTQICQLQVQDYGISS